MPFLKCKEIHFKLFFEKMFGINVCMLEKFS